MVVLQNSIFLNFGESVDIDLYYTKDQCPRTHKVQDNAFLVEFVHNDYNFWNFFTEVPFAVFLFYERKKFLESKNYLQI